MRGAVPPVQPDKDRIDLGHSLPPGVPVGARTMSVPPPSGHQPRVRASAAPPATAGSATARPRPDPATAKALRKARRRARLAALVAVIVMITGVGVALGAYYFDSVPTPTELALPQSTTVYYADGK